MPKIRDRDIRADVRPAVKAAEGRLKRLRQVAKTPGVELWDVEIIDNPVLVEPIEGDEFDDEPEIVVQFVIGSRGRDKLYIHRWSMVGVGPQSTSGTRTPLQTLARVAIWAVEDALDVRAAHGMNGGVAYGPLPPEVLYMASVTNGTLNWGRGMYQVADGQLQDVGGQTARPRARRPTSTAKRNEIEQRIPAAVKEYRRALEHGSRSPTSDVARALNVGRSTAARALAEARRQGLLGPARRTSAGELL